MMVFYLKIHSPKIVAKIFFNIVKIGEKLLKYFLKFDILVILMIVLTRINQLTLI